MHQLREMHCLVRFTKVQVPWKTANKVVNKTSFCFDPNTRAVIEKIWLVENIVGVRKKLFACAIYKQVKF